MDYICRSQKKNPTVRYRNYNLWNSVIPDKADAQDCVDADTNADVNADEAADADVEATVEAIDNESWCDLGDWIIIVSIWYGVNRDLID